MRTDGLLRLCLFVAATATTSLVTAHGQSAVARHSLESTDGLRPLNVSVTPATHLGRKGVRVAMSDALRRRLDSMTPEERNRAAQIGSPDEQLVVIDGPPFGNGVIEAESAGAPLPGAADGARGFVGIAFRLQQDLRTYDAFYLRPTNGRADDQLRRNHSAQYISHPDWPWFRLRSETPGKYESYVDLVAGEWTRVKIEVRGAQARLYVHGQSQPTLVVDDVKSRPDAKGAIALWLDIGTEAFFRDLTVTPNSSGVARNVH